MANKEFISQQARKRFEEPPQLSETERSSLLVIPPWAKLAIDQILSPTNKAGFILQLGYFRLMGRFFHPKTYLSKDTDFIVQKFLGDPNEVDIDEYKTSTYPVAAFCMHGGHKQYILNSGMLKIIIQ